MVWVRITGVRHPRLQSAPSVDSADYRARARRRREAWLTTAVSDPPSVRMDAESVTARLLVMTELAEAGWALSGRPLPTYERGSIPGAVIRSPRQA